MTAASPTPTGSPTSPTASTLIASLGAQRRHVLGAIEGLDDAALRRPVLPTGWSCLGLVRHLTVDIEAFWFPAVVAGEPDAIAALADAPDDGWIVPDDVPAAEVLDAYRRAAIRADEILAATPLDAPPAWWPEELFGAWRLDDVHEVALHVLVETACHAGHLDAARELLDGTTWLVLT